MFICAICQDSVAQRPDGLPENEDVVVTALQCGHVFHRSCVLKWFRKRRSRTEDGMSCRCPLCKSVASFSTAIRLYPSGDEDNNVNTADTKTFVEEIAALKRVLQSVGRALETEQAAHEQLKLEHANQPSNLELLNLQMQIFEKQKTVELLTQKLSKKQEKLELLKEKLVETQRKLKVANRYFGTTVERQSSEVRKLKMSKKQLFDEKEALERELDTAYMKIINEITEEYVEQQRKDKFMVRTMLTFFIYGYSCFG